MEVLYPHCAGLDVHKETVVACMRHMVGGTVKREVRTFDTTTTGLLALADWLASEGCTVPLGVQSSVRRTSRPLNLLVLKIPLLLMDGPDSLGVIWSRKRQCSTANAIMRSFPTRVRKCKTACDPFLMR